MEDKKLHEMMTNNPTITVDSTLYDPHNLQHQFDKRIDRMVADQHEEMFKAVREEWIKDYPEIDNTWPFLNKKV